MIPLKYNVRNLRVRWVTTALTVLATGLVVWSSCILFGLVEGNKTKLEPGMCFSNEPTIAIYGEFGVRLEDCMFIGADRAQMFTKQSPAIDQPFG